MKAFFDQLKIKIDSMLVKEFFYIIIVLIVTILIRVPFLLNDIGFNNDAPVYSSNIEKNFFSGTYDVQVPGYVSYIYLARLINIFLKNPVHTQNLINLILLFFISIAFFRLLKQVKYNNLESLIFSIIFSFNNILMLGSLTGGNRLFLTLCSILLIYLSFEILFNNKIKLIYLFSFLLAFFCGFRQDLIIYFLPLFIFLFYKIKDFKYFTVSIIIFTFICLTWFIPLIMEYGGISSYIFAIKNQHAVYNTSIIFNPGKINSILNMARVFIYLLNAFLLIFPFFMITIIKKEFKINKEYLTILLFSIIPAFLFQILVHNGNYVHLTAFMAPFFIFLIFNFNLKNKARIGFSLIIIFLLIFQFFGIKMFKGETFGKKLANVLWLQYSYDGAKKGETYRLNELKGDTWNLSK